MFKRWGRRPFFITTWITYTRKIVIASFSMFKFRLGLKIYRRLRFGSLLLSGSHYWKQSNLDWYYLHYSTLIYFPLSLGNPISPPDQSKLSFCFHTWEPWFQGNQKVSKKRIVQVPAGTEPVEPDYSKWDAVKKSVINNIVLTTERFPLHEIQCLTILVFAI
jgi:hypothetical protein